jgi:hypothetical protein
MDGSIVRAGEADNDGRLEVVSRRRNVAGGSDGGAGVISILRRSTVSVLARGDTRRKSRGKRSKRGGGGNEGVEETRTTGSQSGA